MFRSAFAVRLWLFVTMIACAMPAVAEVRLARALEDLAPAEPVHADEGEP